WCLIVALLPARVAGQQFQSLTGPAVQQHHQLVTVGRADEVAAAGQLAEVADRVRRLHDRHHCTPVDAVAGAVLAPATTAGSFRPSESLVPALGCTVLTIRSSTSTVAPSRRHASR